MYIGRSFVLLRTTTILVISRLYVLFVKSIIKKAQKRYPLSVESHTRYSGNPTQSFLSSINLTGSTTNSPQQPCYLPCTYFFLCLLPRSESQVICLLMLSLADFLIGNIEPISNLVPIGFLIFSLLTVNNIFSFLCV